MAATEEKYINEFISSFINNSDINRVTLRLVLNHLQEEFRGQEIPQDYVLKFASDYVETRKQFLKEQESGKCPIVCGLVVLIEFNSADCIKMESQKQE